jgi:ribonuclease HI
MREILNNREATGKIAKWSIELSMYNVIYKPRIAINAQALSAFMAEWTETQTPPREWELEYWIINFDGSLQLQGARVGILVTPPKGESIKYVLQMHFPTSNNTAKYEALLYGPRIAIALSIHWLQVLGDSLLIVNQANKEWSCLDDKMRLYCQELSKLENNFDGKNEVVDELAKLGSSRAMVPTGVFLEELHEPSISKALAKGTKAVESSQETTTKREQNRVTWSHGNPLRLAHSVCDIFLDRGLASGQDWPWMTVLLGRTVHSSKWQAFSVKR